MAFNSIRCVLLVFYSTMGLGVIAKSYPFRHRDNGERSTPDMFVDGSSVHENVLTDANGYRLIQDESTSRLFYAIENSTSGELISSGVAVGKNYPLEGHTPQRLRPSPRRIYPKERQLHEGRELQHRRLSFPTTGTLKNLVILVRFKNHKDSNRPLPPPEDYDILFNHDGAIYDDHAIAPTGSVRDVYRINSYGKLILESKVFGWVDLPETEAYYANGDSGFATNRFAEVLHSAMDALRESFYSGSFSEFDGNGDGKVDMVTLIHSGYAAEFNDDDVDNAQSRDRIWSHQRKLPRKRRWYPDPNNKDGDAHVYQYSTAPGLFGVSGSSIGRIGVICHEIGHALGLPDLYGTDDGNGLGSYDFMSNHWGFPRYFHLAQLYPPVMSAWTKTKVGWVDPILIDKSGNYTIENSQFTGEIYRINMDDEGFEYLLIENRQPIGFDSFLPHGGLAIWHIDETASNVEGYPGQEGIPWPLNAKHYKVALLQADGNYDLERRFNNGDDMDLFHGDGVDFLAPSINFMQGPYPSTDTYRGAILRRTGICIHDIGSSSMSMAFSVTLMKELSSTFLGGNGARGNMFDVLPLKDISIRKLYLNINVEGTTKVELWIRSGTHVSFETKPWLWSRHSVVTVEGNGKGKHTSMDVENLNLNANTRYGIYLVMIDGKFRYTNGVGVGSISASNEDLIIYEGAGLTQPFSSVYHNRIWNGNLFYEVRSTAEDVGRRLSTTFGGKAGHDGARFDVTAQKNLLV